MKLIIAIVQDYDCDRLLRTVTAAGFGATRIASTGGFLRMRNTTVLLGVPDQEVGRCLDLIRSTCQSRLHRVPEAIVRDMIEWDSAGIAEVPVGGAVVFVANISRYERVAPRSCPTHQDDTIQ